MKAITTTYYGATNTRGSRIVASDEDNNRVSLSYDDALNSGQNHDAAARALCIKMDWTSHRLHSGATKTGYVYVFAYPGCAITFTEAEREQGRANRIARRAK